MNNRQANGRRRGRGGQQQQRPGGSSNQRDNGNRIDSRARGNAAQLLEKYKNLARDAQMQGDRVNTEYYLQFADHYFRVLSETRTRFEENNPGQQQPRPQRADLEDDDFGYETEGNRTDQRDDNRADQDQRDDRAPREERAARDDRGPRQDRAPREDRAARDDRPAARANSNGNGHYNKDAQTQSAPFEGLPGDESQGQRRRGRPRRDAAPEAAVDAIDAAVLPPALGADPGSPDEQPEEKPRRRGRPRRDAEVPAA